MSADKRQQLVELEQRLQVSKVRDLDTKLAELASEIRDLEHKVLSGEFRGDDGQMKLASETQDLKTKLTKLENESQDLQTKLQSEQTKLQSEHTKLQSALTKLQSEFRDFWDVQVKGVNYLMIAHAAGLVTCVTLLKDYKDSSTQLKGIGIFVSLFGCGLILAITAFVQLLTQRLLLFSSGASGDIQETEKVLQETEKVPSQIKLAAAVSSISCAFLVAAIVVAIWKFSSL